MKIVIYLIIVALIILLLYLYYKHAKKFKFDSVVMINGAVGSGKSAMTFYQGIKAHRKGHAIWWRRTHIYSLLFKKLKDEEEPLLYCNIPVYKNIKKKELYKYYRPLTTEHILRIKRFNYKSVVCIDESSLLANSMTGSMRGQDFKEAKLINDRLTLFLKLIRQEMHGSYRNIFGGYANMFINTQSKNDNHFAFDRCLNQVLYITKNMNIPFFRIIWCRELLLIDSVENNFNDDYKEDISTRWYLMPKTIFKKYNSYAYSFLTDNKEKIKEITKYIVILNRFEIPTLTSIGELIESNNIFKKEIAEKERKEQEEHGEQEMV